MARLARRPVCILPTLLALLTRTVLGKQRWNIVDAEVLCECDWKNNFWLHIADDVQQIFSEKTDYVLVRSQKENRSRQKQPGWQRLRRAARELCPLDASRWPPPASAAVAPRWRFDVGWVGEASASTASGRAASATARTFWPKEVFSDLCLPGLVFSDLLCILDLTFTHEPSPSRMLRAGRLARRLRAVLQWVKPCWREPFATLRLSDLDHFAERWSDVEGLWPDAVPPEQLLFEGLSVDFSRASLPPTLRRCWPVTTTEQGGCWPRHTPVATGSCSMCCDVHFTRGDPSCFQGPWSFERCCLPDDLDHGWPPPTPPVEHRVRRAVAAVGEDGGDSADDDVVSGELEELRKELREEVEEEVSMEDVKALRRQELKKWLSQQSFRSPGQQKIFPELDLWVASNACVGREVEVPWFLLSDTATVDDASGLRLAAAAGALCGPGLAARGERGSAARTRTARPRQRPGTGWHKVEPYGLEILMPCKLQRPTTSGCSCDGNVSIPCGFSPAEHGTCCREQREEPEWRSLGVLTGELRSNIAHFARDALWLHRVLNDQETLQVLGFSTRLPRAERVLTKHAATECVENWQCAKTGSHMLSEMEPLETFLEEVALEGTPPLATFSAGDPALDHTICYELIVQRWRPWSFDASNVRRFRARALRKCQLEDRGLQKKIVLVKRESFTRQWKDEGKVLEHFETLALAIGADFDLVNLGRLTPCEQVDALQDAMLLVAVHGADLTNMIFLPPAAAVVEIGVECELEGASVDSPFWRGPGTWMNSSILSGARQIWKEQQARGWCPAMGATLPPEAWLQGAPTSQFAKLARQANLFYTAVMDCAGAACNRAQEKGQWDRGWCNSDVKKRPFVEVDVAKKLIPVLWVVYDEYLRKLLSASSTVDS